MGITFTRFDLVPNYALFLGSFEYLLEIVARV